MNQTQAYETYYYQLADKEHGDWHTGYGKKMLDFVSEHIQSDPIKLLEVGCGTAQIAKYLPALVEYTGVDSSAYALEKSHQRPGAKFVSAPAQQLPFVPSNFDFVLSRFSLEHFDQPRESLLEMLRVLKPGGKLIILTPNLEFPFSYPTALRHKAAWYRWYFYALRLSDYFLRLLGIYRFRTISENYLQKTGRYEKNDDDLVYLASAYEVIAFLKKQGCKLLHSNYFVIKRWSFQQIMKKLITFLPGLKYFGTELFIVVQKE